MSTGNDFVSAEWVKARKEHHCEECSKAILPGSTYQRHAQVYEGEFAALKFCRKCAVLWSLIQKRPWWHEDEWTYGSLREYIRGHAEVVLWKCQKKWEAVEPKEATA